ncbi:MAG: MFS transporter [Treponema sp.]|nr:MFS transporter [Treponema sp.]
MRNTFFTRKNITLFLLVMCAFINALNSSIVANALPVMTTELGIDSIHISWVITVFLIVTTSTILVFGRLGDIFGNVFILQSGLIVFAAGSLLCGISRTFSFLIAARIIQAIGTGAVMANNHGIITRIFPAQERGKALGLNAAFVALGNITGPSAGGFILNYLNWHWLFLIMVPVALLLFIFQHILIPSDRHFTNERIDCIGSLLFVLSVSLIFYGFQNGSADSGASFVTKLYMPAGLVFFVLFIIRQLTCRYHVLDLSLFQNREFDVNLLCASASYVSIQVYNIIIPFYFQYALSMNAGESGLYMSVYPVILVCVAPLSGMISDKLGAEKITVAGLFLLGLGQCLISFACMHASLLSFMFFIVIMSVGNGMFQSPNNSMIMSSVPLNKVGVGGSLNALVRNFGQNIGVVIATSGLYSGMSSCAGYRITNLNGNNRELFLYGMSYVFRITTVILFIALILSVIRLMHKNQKQEAVYGKGI